MISPEQPAPRTPEQASAFDPLFSFLEWEAQEVGAELLEYIPRRPLEKSSPAIIHRAELKFYKNFNQLLRVTFLADPPGTPYGARLRRGYALCQRDDTSEVKPLDGTSSPLHETNRLKGELKLSGGLEKAVNDYLKFFCSAVHGEDGPFLILDESNYAMILAGNPPVPESLIEELRLGIRSEAEPGLKEDFATLGNPLPGSMIKRRRACIIYSSSLFRAWFAIDDESSETPGIVRMLKEEPILTGLKVDIPKYADGSLFVLQKLDRSFASEHPTHYYHSEVFSSADREMERHLGELTAADGDAEIIFCDGKVLARK